MLHVLHERAAEWFDPVQGAMKAANTAAAAEVVHTSICASIVTGMRSACRVVQVIAQLALVFPALPASAIADALDKAGGDVQHAANALFAEEVNARPKYLLSSVASRVL